MRASIRTVLLLYALALAALAALVLLAVGLPLAARHTNGAAALLVVALLTGIVVLVAGGALLFRGIAQPVERLMNAAARLDPGTAVSGDLPILGAPGESGGPALTRAAIAFERLVAALDAERSRLAAKVDELTESNRALAEARESLIRSEKLATVGRLAAGLAHEVGNPLGAVSGYVDLARSRLPPEAHPDLVDALGRIEVAAARIDRTLRDLLDFARPAAPVLAPIELGHVVDASLRLARVQARFKNVDVALEIPAGVARVLADEHQLSQVLLNLLLNAGDAMEGTGRVAITARNEEDGVVVAIADSGPGIAAADLPRIFDPFFTTKDPGAGTGLGLAISHRIMESFGGEIVASNADGGGALFELRFRAC